MGENFFTSDPEFIIIIIVAIVVYLFMFIFLDRGL